MADEASEARRRPGWVALFVVAALVAACAAVVVVVAVVGQPDVSAAARDLPPGHPHDRIVHTRTSFRCASLVQHALGDRDPLCRDEARSSAAWLLASLLVVAVSIGAARWCWRQSTGASGETSRGWTIARGVAIGAAVVLLVLAGIGALAPSNDGAWTATRSAPPEVPGLRAWEAEVRPLLSQLADETDAYASAINRGAFSTLPARCEQWIEVAERLAAVPTAPEAQLDALTRAAIAHTRQTAESCRTASTAGNQVALLDLGLTLVDATESWQAVTDRVLELELGPS